LSDHLCFTHDEYHAVRRASRALPTTGPVRAFQHALADSLLLTHALLAARVAGWCEKQVCILLDHLTEQENARATVPAARSASEGQSECRLTFEEWRAVSNACAVVALHDSPLPTFKGRLLQEVAHAEPRLAAKLSRLSENQVVALYEQIKAGKRWTA